MAEAGAGNDDVCDRPSSVRIGKDFAESWRTGQLALGDMIYQVRRFAKDIMPLSAQRRSLTCVGSGRLRWASLLTKNVSNA